MPPAKRQRLSTVGILRRSDQKNITHSTALAARRLPTSDAPISLSFLQPGDDGRSIPDSKLPGHRGNKSTEPDLSEKDPSNVSLAVAKLKRVRTGCLTCRTRHLKCDEALPICQNCKKSNRKCERGVRLNFIDLKVEQPPILLAPVDWKVQFQDESREIASEYVGGLKRYAKLIAPPPVTPTTPLGCSGAYNPAEFSQDASKGGRADPPPAAYCSTTESRTTHQSSHAIHEAQMTQVHPCGDGDGLIAINSWSTPEFSKFGHRTRAMSVDLERTTQDPCEEWETAVPSDPDLRSRKSSPTTSLTSSLVVQASSRSASESARGSRSPTPSSPDNLTMPFSKTGERNYLSSPEEIHYMQVFISEVAVWMDGLDNQEHFGRIIPYLALKSSMLLNAFLACGVKHLMLVDGGSFKDNKALHYYDTATTQLLRSLQNPERDTEECATAAVVLNVYEVMSEKPAARMNHIAGARALIRECRWDAKSTGVGAACFWLNVGLEILSCLSFNWATAWDPDHWGVDPDELMNMAADTPSSSRKGKKPNAGEETGSHRPWSAGTSAKDTLLGGVSGVGDEEIWVHRILYIVAKITNFRANIRELPQLSLLDDEVRLQGRHQEWLRLKSYCDAWKANCPRSLKPYGYVLTSSTTTSAFPNVWLLKRSATVGCLLYHTAMCLLAQINPLNTTPHEAKGTRIQQLHHAHQVCGILAHNRDRGVASVAVRSLAVAGGVLTKAEEQDEVLAILDRINRATGWDLRRVVAELRKSWGSDPVGPPDPPYLPDLPGVKEVTGSDFGRRVYPSAPVPLIVPLAAGGTLGAAAVMSQLFGLGDGAAGQTMQEARRTSILHPPLLLPSPKAASSSGSLLPLLPPCQLLSSPPTSPTLALAEHHRQCGFPLQGNAQHLTSQATVSSSSTASSNQAIPARGTVHTTASNVSRMAATPPLRPTVNPLLVQADFNKPNHPYRDWYKPPDRGASIHPLSVGSGIRSSTWPWPY